MPLDKQLYCGKCGSFTNDFACVKCSKKVLDIIKKAILEKAGKIKRSLPKDLFFGSVIIIIILLSSDNLITDLQSGSARANNAFVERWNEFYDDPDCASDHEWLFGFDSAAEGLYQLDARWQSVKPRTVQSGCLTFFMEYADASFQQMKLLEQIVENVHNAVQVKRNIDEIHTELDALQDEFSKTIASQTRAMKYYASISPQWDLFGKFGYICFDGVRALLPSVNIILLSIVFMIGCGLMLVYMLNGFSNTTITELEKWLQKSRVAAETRNEKYALVHFTAEPVNLLNRTAVATKSCCFCFIRVVNELWLLILHLIGMVGLFFLLFSRKNISSCVRWVKAGLTDVKGIHNEPSFAYKHRKRPVPVAAVIIFVLIIGINAFSVNRCSVFIGESSDEQEYLFAAKAAISDYAVDISKILLDICNTRTLTEEDRERFYGLIDMQIEADEAILDYDMAGLEDYQMLHTGLQSLCKDDIMALQRIKKTLEDGLVPSQELQRNYVSLRGENYLWVIEDVAMELSKQAAMSISD